jgi:hypothetical protein
MGESPVFMRVERTAPQFTFNPGRAFVNDNLTVFFGFFRFS